MPALFSMKIILVIFMVLVIIIAACLAAATANFAKKAGNPDKYPNKRSDAATMALAGAATCFGAIILVMALLLFKTAAKTHMKSTVKSVTTNTIPKVVTNQIPADLQNQAMNQLMLLAK